MCWLSGDIGIRYYLSLFLFSIFILNDRINEQHKKGMMVGIMLAFEHVIPSCIHSYCMSACVYICTMNVEFANSYENVLHVTVINIHFLNC